MSKYINPISDKYRLSRNIDIDALNNKGETLLHLQTKLDHFDIIEQIDGIKKNIKYYISQLLIRDNSGITPLDSLADRYNEMIKYHAKFFNEKGLKTDFKNVDEIKAYLHSYLTSKD